MGFTSEENCLGSGRIFCKFLEGVFSCVVCFFFPPALEGIFGESDSGSNPNSEKESSWCAFSF